MTFSSTRTEYGNSGSKAVTRGTYTNAGGDTGGDIDTGLTICTAMFLTEKGSTASTDVPVVNATFPTTGEGISGAAIAIVTQDGVDGYWEAEGHI
jgi:hypothetical protein